MSGTDQAPLLDALRQYLRTIQKPGVSVESLALDDPLVASGLLDSLAIMQIVVWLEERYGIDFAASGFDPERLATMGSIVALIEQSRG
ncbi:MAG: acyl carrier protein [Rhodoferax sp.]|jgi:acyl carrier protein|nr:acyl carrier protein [Rhodoferax sp.]